MPGPKGNQRKSMISGSGDVNCMLVCHFSNGQRKQPETVNNKKTATGRSAELYIHDPPRKRKAEVRRPIEAITPPPPPIHPGCTIPYHTILYHTVPHTICPIASGDKTWSPQAHGHETHTPSKTLTHTQTRDDDEPGREKWKCRLAKIV